MEKGKRIDASLPEAMIQHIQSFLSGKEAARTTLVSKSWYNAWLTCPSLAFDQRDFENLSEGSSSAKLSKFAAKTMKRYRRLKLKIGSLRLQTQSTTDRAEQRAHKIIVEALKIGATDLNLESLPPSVCNLPQEVFQSNTLLRLSVKRREIDEKFKCSMLRSLTLDSVFWESRYMARDMISSCISIEELSILNPKILDYGGLTLSRKHLPELCKLERLHLEMLDIGYSFFLDWDSRFPRLKDLSLVRCEYDDRISTKVSILSTSLRRIRIVQHKVMKGKFTAPNLARFSYSGMGMPTLALEARECESHISLKTNGWRSSSWFLKLQKLLSELSPSKINLSLSGSSCVDKEEDLQVVGKTVVVENVTFGADITPSCDLLVQLFRIIRPKFVSHFWLPMEGLRPNSHNHYKCSLKSLWETLMREVITPDCGVPDHDVFGQFGLKEVHMRVYEESLTQWRPLLLEGPVDALIVPPNKRKVRFELKW